MEKIYFFKKAQDCPFCDYGLDSEDPRATLDLDKLRCEACKHNFSLNDYHCLMQSHNDLEEQLKKQKATLGKMRRILKKAGAIQ
ncbi:hypothetical protein ACHJH3_06835 [Campylobacter sp. MOP7]|uniref:hypothetical protein n=1 Tax=Campylobacter canis TaxID=3378588 RepID=UPI00387EBA71